MSAKRITRGFAFAAILACWILAAGCEYDVPITSSGTRKIDPRLLGKWVSKDGKDKLTVVKLDDSDYIVLKNEDNGENLYRAWHSDVGGTPFVTVQELEGDKRKFAYWKWELAGDDTLVLRLVNDKVIPDEVKSSSAARKLLKQNLKNPELFAEGEAQYIRAK